ncbi:MAG: SLC13 family permease [Candidatus Kariarchaeaceae archaeon]|jgi:Na+/H+ antiporter NhaD/arsenite permease-like protein
MDLTQIVLIIIASITILSILPERADKSRNILAGGGIAVIILAMTRYIGKDGVTEFEVGLIYSELIKWDVLVLIIFLSIFVDMLDDLGYFEYIGIHLVKITKGDQKKLFVSLGVMMFFMSAFLDNVTAIILLSSLTITVCRRLEISPIPYISYLTFMTGVGALLTPVGSVPNIIINSGARISFAKWVGIMSGFALVSMGITTIYFLRIYKKQLIYTLSDDKKEELTYLDPNQVIKGMKDVYLATALIGLLVVLFVIAEQVHIGIEIMAAGTAIITMILTRTPSRGVWAKVDWNTLFFFSGLFIVVGALDFTGALNPISSLIEDMIKTNPTVLLLLVILLGGLVSTGLNNIPISLLLTSIFLEVTGVTEVGIEYWFALVIATNIGASLTPIGSVIVIIAFEILRKSGNEIKLSHYFSITFPLFIIISFIGFGYLTIITELGWIT